MTGTTQERAGEVTNTCALILKKKEKETIIAAVVDDPNKINDIIYLRNKSKIMSKGWQRKKDVHNLFIKKKKDVYNSL